MTTDPILNKVDALNTWRRGGERAPHKPLLLLLALGELSRGKEHLAFAECETKLRDLLREFGPSRRQHRPEYPFWRLQNDGLWEVRATGHLHVGEPAIDPPVTQLRLGQAVGSFPAEIRHRLIADPALRTETAQRLLVAHFPETLHQDILDSVGLSLDLGNPGRKQRDPEFRTRVLRAYEYRCALCGLDIRIGNVTVALEGAHIRWFQAGGPDTECNGIALCSTHHKVFDLGAFTIDTDQRVLVSECVHGTGPFQEVLLRFHGGQVNPPNRREHEPAREHLSWHRREVFKEGPRSPNLLG